MQKLPILLTLKLRLNLKQGDFSGGTLAGTKSLILALEKPIKSNQSAPLPITPDLQETPVRTLPNTSTIVTQTPTLSEESNQAGNTFLGLLAAGGLAAAIGTFVYKRNRVELEPEGESRFKGGSRICKCATCKKRMEQVDDSIIQATLSEPEKVAQKIGSLRFEGWKCSQCSQQLAETGYHRVAYQPHISQFCECPTCQELTVKRTVQILQHPTELSTGERLITEECHCCDYRTEREERIPCLPPSPPPSSSSSSGSSYDSGSSSSSSSSSSSYDSGSSSSSSYGGGDSGGGGAGGSW